MKKILFSMLGAGLILTSCSSDEPFATGEGGEKQVTFTLNVPDAVGTRAGEQSSSDKGGVSNTNSALNYTIALYYGGELEWSATAKGEGTSVTFNPTVILGRNYQVVAYADFEGTKDDLKAISIANGINDESKDAYFVSQSAQFTETDLTEDITLKRPFGKLRLVATDYDETKALKDVTVTYTNGAHLNQFNAFSGEFAETVDGSNVYKDAEYDVAYTEAAEREKTIFVDYIPVNSDSMFPFKITVTYTKGGESFTRTFTQDIPVKRNVLTTLKGDFFTANATINVTVVEDFDSNIEKEIGMKVSTSAELIAALRTAVAAGQTNIVFDANGANIGAFNRDSNPSTSFTNALVPSGVTVTVRNAIVEGVSQWNQADGTLIFENCKFTNNSAYSINFHAGTGKAVFNNCELEGWCSFDGVTVEMNNCSIKGNGTYALVRSYQDMTMTDCTINTDNAIQDDNWPDGLSISSRTDVARVLTMTNCKVESGSFQYGTSDSYVLMDGKRLVNDPTSLEAALKNGNIVLMENDIAVEAHLTNTSHGSNINIDGGGNTLTLRGIYGNNGANVSLSNMTLVDSNPDDYTIYNQGGKIELNNVTYSSNINKAFQMAGGGDVVLTNCNISGDVTGTYSASNIWCGDGRNVTVNGGTYGSIFMNAQYHQDWIDNGWVSADNHATTHAASKITLNDGTINKLTLETELGAEGYYVSATLTKNGGTITNLVENPQELDLTGREKYNK